MPEREPILFAMKMSPALTFAILLLATSFDHAVGKDLASFEPPSAFRTIRCVEYGGGPTRVYQTPNIETEILYESDGLKLILTVAEPPTTATPTMVAGLFVIVLKGGIWTIADSRRFEAVGKYSDAKAKATQSERAEPHISLTLYQGGGGESYAQCASYRVVDSKFQLDTPTETKIGESGPRE